MRLVIDGYNVIFAETGKPVLTDRAARHNEVTSMLRRVPGECERFRTELLQQLEQYRLRSGEDITVVFDGGPAGAHLARFQHHGGIEVIFSDPASDADSEIKDFVHDSSGARDLRVITDDRELAQASKRLGAKVAPTEWLLDRMKHAQNRAGDEETKAEPAGKFSGPADFEVEGWVNEFGDLDEEDFENGEPPDEK